MRRLSASGWGHHRSWPQQAGVGVDVGRVLTVPAADLALLPVGGPADDPRCEPALFGRLDREPGPPVPVAAAGCPRFKLRPAPARPGVLLRELDYAIGSIAALSDAKTDRFAFAVDVPPGPDPEPDKHSPWEGMSGAAVWASGRLIGVVGQHHPREGLATLTVRPVEQLFGSASEDQLQAWRAALPQLPATAEDLWLATPPTVRKIEVARARRAAEALAPRVLIGRSAELAALEEFAGSDARWRWIQGDAFAGKTALMAWFALHPPERVDVAACFLRRASGEDTAEYALDVLTRQLALLADRRGYLPPPFRVRAEQRLRRPAGGGGPRLRRARPPAACAHRRPRRVRPHDRQLGLGRLAARRQHAARSGDAASRQPRRSRRPPSSRPSAVRLRAAHHRLRSCHRDPACRARGTRPGREDSRRIPSAPALLSCGRRKRADGQRHCAPC